MQNDETNDTTTQINDIDVQSQQKETENIQQDNQQEVIEQQTLEQQQQSNEALLRQIDDDEPIYILVSNPSEVKSSSMNKYLVYTVKGKDALGNFEVQRRFNEFYTLREALIQIWPGLYIPPLPDKLVNPTGDQLLERVRLLNIFVMKMAQIKYLYYSEEFVQVFLRSTQLDVCKQIQNLPKPNIRSQIEKFKHIFELDQVQEPDSISINKINQMQRFCKQSQQLLIKLFDQAKSLSGSKRCLKELFHSFFGYGLQEFEQQILLPCLNNEKQLILTNPDAQELKSTLDYLKDQNQISLDKIQDLISTEQRDMEAFLQGFQSRESLLHTKSKVENKLREQQEQLTKVMIAKGSSFGKSQEEQRQKIELQIVESQNDVDSYKYYYQLVTHVLTMKAIDKFKKDKHESYKRIIRDLAQLEIENNQVMQEVWTRIISLAESLRVKE
ncbi:unnamed protein product [Paramecium pentaurelia]|uniref:PX domain-containing protein n=1 Tax=Paramecium pentaurelia TaxID=43138 RepID=A0A8S1XXZ3_9CILI|nr:unnamed protein product [Paramecium pentaurelia]